MSHRKYERHEKENEKYGAEENRAKWEFWKRVGMVVAAIAIGITIVVLGAR